MKLTLIVGAAVILVSTLTGCVVAPVPEPVVYGPPPPRVIYAAPPPAVVVRPAPVYYYGYGPYWRGRWR
jgi:hypothetical protein